MPDDDEIPSPHTLRAEFDRLWKAAKSEVLWTVMRIVPNRTNAEEIAHRTSIVLWKKFSTYDRNQPFTPWACGFARNVTRQWLAEQRPWIPIDDDFIDAVEKRSLELREELERQLSHLERCLDKLPEDQGQIVRDYHLHNLGVDAIARFRSRTVGAVYKILQRSMEKLQDCITKSSGEEGGK